jgi:predicted transglutaminase-like cysteine proteinase
MSIGFSRGTWTSQFAALAVFAVAGAALGSATAKASEPVVAPSAQVRLFGSSENTNHDISPFPKWTGMLQRYAQERRLEDAPCTGGRCALQEWKAFVTTLRGTDRLRQLQAVNAYANRISYRSDLDRHGIADRWATPRETFASSADCEDYAIVKYLSLRKLGWSASELRIVVLKHEVRNELHAVLVAYTNGTAYVLDNLIPDVREHAAIGYYRPIFSINEAAWHYHRDWNPGSALLVSKAEPSRAPQGQARILAAPVVTVPAPLPPAVQVAGPVPPAFDTVKAPRYAYQPPLVRQAARSYAANASESMAALFSNAGTIR